MVCFVTNAPSAVQQLEPVDADDWSKGSAVTSIFVDEDGYFYLQRRDTLDELCEKLTLA